MEEDEDYNGAKSELRLIALELMKLATRRHVPFSQIANEFVSNVYLLEKIVRTRGSAKAGGKSQKPFKSRSQD
jgi:hypothetical protein